MVQVVTKKDISVARKYNYVVKDLKMEYTEQNDLRYFSSMLNNSVDKLITMLSGTDFVKKIKEGNKELFEASRSNVRRFFASNPSDEYLVEHFRGRMVNLASQNMYAIAGQVASADPSTDVKDLELLARQAMDEAKHFRMVKEVIEHITGEELDVAAAFKAEAETSTGKRCITFR